MILKDIFERYIIEAPEAGFDDMDDEKITNIEKYHIPATSNYHHRGSFVVGNDTVHLYQTPDKIKYVFGTLKDDKFNEYGYIKLIPLRNMLDYNNIHTVDEVEVANNARKNGVSTELYRFLVLKLHMILLCGDIQFFGARKLWSRLSKQSDLAVDVINIRTQEIIEKNAILSHGLQNNDYDTRYWGVYRGETKFDQIRFILRSK